MYGEVTSRNHQAYSWGHFVHNNTLSYINIAAVCAFDISEITQLHNFIVTQSFHRRFEQK